MSYYANTFRAMTPIGTAMQNIANAMFQSRALSAKHAAQERELAMRQAQIDAEADLNERQLAAQAPMWEASAAKHAAEAEAMGADAARMAAMPDTVAGAFANLTQPQIGQVRQYQKTGSWGASPEIAGLDSLGGGGDWMPAFANPETMGRVNLADMMTGMMSGPQQSDDIAKAITQMMLNSMLSGGDMAGLNEAAAASQGKLYGAPNEQGLYTSQARDGGVMNLDMNNPLVRSDVGATNALARERDAGAGLHRARAATEGAQQEKLRAETATERRNPRGAKGLLTQAQAIDIDAHNQAVHGARQQLQSLWNNDRDKFGARLKSARKGEDRVFAELMARATASFKGQDDPSAADWGAFLTGGGWTTGKGYNKAKVGTTYIKDGRRIPWQQIQDTATKRGKTPEQVIQDLGLVPEA